MKIDSKRICNSIKARKARGLVLAALLTFSFGLIGGLIWAPIALAQEAPKSSTQKPVDEAQLALNNGRLMAAQGRVDDAVNEFRRAAKLKDDKCAECFQLIGG